MASPTPYAQNSFGVLAAPIDFNAAYAPTTQMYHGGTIEVNGKIVGRIDNWNPTGAYKREGNHIYELNSLTWGLPVDYVPGRATDFNVTFTRTEVWQQELEIAFGYGAVFNNLTDQTRPFTAKEILFRGVSPYRTWLYTGCWFRSKTPNAWEAAGDGIIKVDCEMAYVARTRVQ